MKTVAILGASGFLGSHLLDASLEKPGITASGFSRSQKIGLNTYEVFWGNLSRFDVVVNASVSYGRSSSLSAFEANLTFPLDVIQRLVKIESPAAFVNIDSFFTKFPIPFYSQLREYSLSKALLPSVAREITGGANDVDSASVRFVNFRLEHLFGPGDSSHKFVPWLLGQMKHRAPRIPLGTGHQVRDFIHVRDAANLILDGILMMDSLDSQQDLEVGTGIGTSVRDFVETAARISGYEGVLGFGDIPARAGEIDLSVANSYLSSSVGYSSFSSVHEALSEEISRWT